MLRYRQRALTTPTYGARWWNESVVGRVTRAEFFATDTTLSGAGAIDLPVASVDGVGAFALSGSGAIDLPVAAMGGSGVGAPVGVHIQVPQSRRVL